MNEWELECNNKGTSIPDEVVAGSRNGYIGVLEQTHKWTHQRTIVKHLDMIHSTQLSKQSRPVLKFQDCLVYQVHGVN